MMTSSSPRLWMRKAAQLSLLGVFCAATLATSREPEPVPLPTLKMTTTRLSNDGRDCSGDLVVEQGAVPAGKRAVVRLRLQGDRNVPFAYFKEALSDRAKTHCADGLAIVAAEPSTTGAGYDAVVGVAWVHDDGAVLQPPSEIAAPPAPDAGVVFDAGPTPTATQPEAF